MSNFLKKLNMLSFIILLFIIFYIIPTYCIWGYKEKDGYFWYELDGTIAIDGWKLIDDDNDGVGYYYYFNKDGFMVSDDIAPDYRIIGLDGRRVGLDGKTESVKIENIDYFDSNENSNIFSNDILAQIKADEYVSNIPKGVSSSGNYLFAKDPTLNDGPTPADGLVFNDPNQPAQYILGANVVLKKDNEGGIFDGSMDKKMSEYITGGDKYSKKVNGTTFNKSKWKDVMALKGTGASIVFKNPNNNFNKVKGRIATHYFTYSDRTTECTLSVFNEDDGEEIYTTSDFNYNAGTSFEFIFPRKASALRFELDVTGQYTSRVCYLRNCEFGFNRLAYEEELYEDETEMEYRRRVGTESEADYEDYDEEDEGNSLGEISLEGEDPSARYRRLHNIAQDDEYWANFSYDEDDESITEAMRASISEAKRKMALKEEELNKISGPAFDQSLNSETIQVGPGGPGLNAMIEAQGEAEINDSSDDDD